MFIPLIALLLILIGVGIYLVKSGLISADTIYRSSQPTGLTAVYQTTSPVGVVLTWKKSTASNVNGYIIYRSENGKTKDAVQIGATTKDVATYLDQTIVSGKTYYYTAAYSYIAQSANSNANIVKVAVPVQQYNILPSYFTNTSQWNLAPQRTDQSTPGGFTGPVGSWSFQLSQSALGTVTTQGGSNLKYNLSVATKAGARITAGDKGVYSLGEGNYDIIASDNSGRKIGESWLLVDPNFGLAAATTDWKTYTSTTDNYSIMCPKDWVYTLNANKDQLTFQQNIGDKWVFEVDSDRTTLTLQKAVDAEKALKQKAGYIATITNEAIDGQVAEKINLSASGGSPFVEHLVVSKGELYTITLSDGADLDQLNMLKTFQFTTK